VTHRKFNLVHLEDRFAPAVFTVTTVADNGDNLNPTAGSLRAAIISANVAAGADTIDFNLGGSGVRTIDLSQPLPAITEAVSLDGTTQSGYAGLPLVELNGLGLAVAANGLFLSSHTGSTIRGLAIGGFKGAGIRLDGGGDHIVSSNLIGTNAAGISAAPNGIGVFITNSSSDNVIGGVTEATRNIISGNTKTGVRLTNGATGNTISGNFIGTTVNGSIALANGSHGVELSAGAIFNTVGGTVAGSGNIIAGNSGNGVEIADPTTAGNLIAGNRIGIGFSGTGVANALDGVRAELAAGTAPAGGITLPNANFITKNNIGSNTGNGIAVLDSSRSIRIEQNTISNNGQLGIFVAGTANNGLPAPVITSVVTDGGGLKVQGTVTGPASSSIRVEVFGSTTADPSGFGEGTNFLGTVTVVTSAAGTAPFTLNVATNVSISATSQDTATGDSSAFSNAMTQGTSPPPAQFMNRFAVGTGQGANPIARVYEPLGTLAFSITPFDNSFKGGVRVAMADVNGDAALDLIVGTGPGIATQVKVYDGKTQQLLQTFAPFEATFTGGVYVAGGDIDGDGKAEIVITPDEGGGPRVRIFRGSNFTQLSDFFGIADPNFRGGARAAIGDLNGDLKGDVVVAAGFGGGPRIAAFNGATMTNTGGQYLFGDFFAFEQTLRNGSFVAVADLNGDGFADLSTGGGPGGGPRVQILSGKDLTQSNGKQTVLANFFAGNDSNRGGIRIASRFVTGDNLADLVTGDGDGSPGMVRVFAGSSLLADSYTPTVAFVPFGVIAGGVYVG
jgi:parallel beta-helix repeat protein